MLKIKWLWILVAVIAVVGAVFALFFTSGFKTLPVADFEECVARGYEVLDVIPRQCKTPDGQLFGENVGNAAEKANLIILSSLNPNETITSSFIILTGQARGSWFFEASFPIEIVDANGMSLTSGIAKAEGEWMTDEFVPFTAKLELISDYKGPANIILHKDNPSDIPEFDDALIIPVKIDIPAEQITINVYFGKKTSSSATDPCDFVYPVSRSVPKTSAVAKSALMELLKGVTESENTEGYFTSLPNDVGLKRITIIDGVAFADFSDDLEFQVGGSCRVTAIRAQITETLNQFPTVKDVVISINGRTEDILQP
ncbi:MAG: GerMN domain-containing protein [Parcubacteria group bacterium]